MRYVREVAAAAALHSFVAHATIELNPILKLSGPIILSFALSTVVHGIHTRSFSLLPMSNTEGTAIRT